MMTVKTLGNQDAEIVLVQALEQRGLERVEEQIKRIQSYAQRDFSMIAVGVEDWNRELSPWEAPPAFGKEGFGGEAPLLLERILPLLEDASKTYYIGGYSLAGLFALWSCYQTDRFAGVAAASPSVWFPDFDVYMKNNRPRCGAVYLSLGDREEKTKNRMMATVGDRIREGYQLLKDQGIDTVLEWNAGNHFRDADLRVAKAFAWLVNK